MKKNIPWLLLGAPLLIIISLDLYISYLNGITDLDELWVPIFIMVAVAVGSAGVGFLFEKVYQAVILKYNPKADKELRYVFPKIISIVSVALIVYAMSHWIQLSNERAVKECFEKYDEKSRIKNCIETGEMVPDPD